MTKQIKVESIHEKVYQRLREEITSSELAPGEKITIRQVADMYGVSVMPVREALRQLHTEGLVNYERTGVTVKALSAHEIQQIIEIRKRLELLAMEWALPNLKKEDIKKSEEMLEAMDQRTDDDNDWRLLNKEFHLTLYSYCGSQQLEQIIENLWVSIEPYMRIYTSTVSSLEFAQEQHHEMLHSIKHKNLDEFEKLLNNHLNHTAKVILDNF
ncbi:GntR family transcriptional regulator [Sporolactobacillus shoreae]|uniref:GntR family transcriptional regulator n=1 Tax=Sporolactobacillus shoreae TaxID=1465501 RepID=A0A4Z0GUB1_9BACL|nr:GntR family transcriptional regulator [Sporolactobacillus shoreae]TGA99892.1 GntR family transcriptional regulator [Sporolactobacillus shoreae]